MSKKIRNFLLNSVLTSYAQALTYTGFFLDSRTGTGSLTAIQFPESLPAEHNIAHCAEIFSFAFFFYSPVEYESASNIFHLNIVTLIKWEVPLRPENFWFSLELTFIKTSSE